MMTIKQLGQRIASVWDGLRPQTKKILAGVFDSKTPATSLKKFSFDPHAGAEISRLLSALDESAENLRSEIPSSKTKEISRLADRCAEVLENQISSAEVFIQLATRAIKRGDYRRLDALADRLAAQLPPFEIAEIARQSSNPQIGIIAMETLAMLPVEQLKNGLGDPLYSEIFLNALAEKAFEMDSAEAREILEKFA